MTAHGTYCGRVLMLKKALAAQKQRMVARPSPARYQMPSASSISGVGGEKANWRERPRYTEVYYRIHTVFQVSEVTFK